MGKKQSRAWQQLSGTEIVTPELDEDNLPVNVLSIGEPGFFEALKKRGVIVEYMVKNNEGHGFKNEENNFDFYRAMETFLQKYIGKETINNDK